MQTILRIATSMMFLAMAGAGASPALAADPPAKPGIDAIVERHMTAFLHHDWDQAILDYADDAVFVLPTGPIEGKPAILAFFHAMDAQRPVFTVSRVPSVGDVGLEDWVMNAGQPGAVKGRDVFVIRNGKISVQSTIGFGPATP